MSGGLIPSRFIPLALSARSARNHRFYAAWWGRSIRNGYGVPSLDLTRPKIKARDPLWVRIAAWLIAAPLVLILVVAVLLRPVVAPIWRRIRP